MATLRDDLLHLLAVQAVDTRLDRARTTLAALDAGTATAASYNAGKADFDTLRTTAVKAQGAQRDAELGLQTIENQIKATDTALYGSTPRPARELSDLQKKREMLTRQKDDAELKVLEAMEAAQTALSAAQTKENGLSKLAEQYRALRATFKEKSGALGKEVAAIEAERATVAKPITPALLSQYDAIRAKKNGVGVALIVGDSCGACHTRLSSSLVDEVRAAKTPQQCEHCGRILAPDITP